MFSAVTAASYALSLELWICLFDSGRCRLVMDWCKKPSKSACHVHPPAWIWPLPIKNCNILTGHLKKSGRLERRQKEAQGKLKKKEREIEQEDKRHVNETRGTHTQN